MHDKRYMCCYLLLKKLWDEIIEIRLVTNVSLANELKYLDLLQIDLMAYFPR